MNVVIAGGGIFGLTTAIALRNAGHTVALFDRSPIPSPLAESTDISKVVRMDYGSDTDYFELAEQAIRGWLHWNEQWNIPLYHPTGVTFLTRQPMKPGEFEHDSFVTQSMHGYPLERLDEHQIVRRFPAFGQGEFIDGYFNPNGGWVEAASVVSQLAREAAGVMIETGTVVRIVDDGVFVRRSTLAPAHVRADLVVVCAGSWAVQLVPALASSIRAIGHPVFHLRPDDPERFCSPQFPVFGADIARTGYYGFPANADGIVKIANHGKGIPVNHDADRLTTEAQEADLRAFLTTALPALAQAPIVARRLCAYADASDGNFWFARDPERPNVFVATGGSGHAFKFAPILGELIAGLIRGEQHPLAHKFRWRPELATQIRGDSSRATS